MTWLKPLIPVTASSGNVFANIGVPRRRLAKRSSRAEFADRSGSRLTPGAAAAVMGSPTKVSALLSGRLTNFR